MELRELISKNVTQDTVTENGFVFDGTNCDGCATALSLCGAMSSGTWVHIKPC